MIFLNLGSFLAHLEPQLQVFTSPAKTDPYLYAYACAFKHLALTQYFVVIFITISLIGCPFPTCYLDTVASSDFYLDLFLLGTPCSVVMEALNREQMLTWCILFSIWCKATSSKSLCDVRWRGPKNAFDSDDDVMMKMLHVYKKEWQWSLQWSLRCNGALFVKSWWEIFGKGKITERVRARERPPLLNVLEIFF